MKHYQVIQIVKNYYGNADGVFYLMGFKYGKSKWTCNGGSAAVYNKEDADKELEKLNMDEPATNPYSIIEADPTVIHDLRCLAL